MSLSFKRRIALGFMTTTALIVALAFACLYFIVERTVYANLDKELDHQAAIHTHEVTMEEGRIRFVNKLEWEEREHKEAEVNPVFLQLMNGNGVLMDKSPNLKENNLGFELHQKQAGYFSTVLNGKHVRQYQTPVHLDGKPAGYIVVALSLEPTLMLIANLRWTLFILYPLILLVVFLASSVLAGRSIAPVKQIIDKSNSITRTNLSERIDLPANEDELHALITALNGMLDRIQNAMIREEQFTSDASHELRTPLTILKGTLEVLVRRDRTTEEYKEKINESLQQINRMENIVENLLELARMEHTAAIEEEPHAPLKTILQEVAGTLKGAYPDKTLHLWSEAGTAGEQQVPVFHASLILSNLLENALKYSYSGGEVTISTGMLDGRCTVRVEDQGRGMSETDRARVKQPFFRSSEVEAGQVKGSGLGLSIADKAANAIGAHISFEANEPQGTRAIIQF